MTVHRHDELAAMDLSMIAVALTPSCLYASLVIFFIIPVLFSFVFVHETIYIILVFITVKTFKIRKVYFVFSFRIFVSADLNYGP